MCIEASLISQGASRSLYALCIISRFADFDGFVTLLHTRPITAPHRQGQSGTRPLIGSGIWKWKSVLGQSICVPPMPPPGLRSDIEQIIMQSIQVGVPNFFGYTVLAQDRSEELQRSHFFFQRSREIIVSDQVVFICLPLCSKNS